MPNPAHRLALASLKKGMLQKSCTPILGNISLHCTSLDYCTAQWCDARSPQRKVWSERVEIVLRRGKFGHFSPLAHLSHIKDRSRLWSHVHYAIYDHVSEYGTIVNMGKMSCWAFEPEMTYVTNPKHAS
jgi:hypothetical protein